MILVLTLSWVQIITLVAGSSVLAAILTQLLAALQEHLRRRRAASFLAIRMATILEKFAEACMSIIGDFDTFEQSFGAAGARTTKLPNLEAFPDDADGWRALPTSLTANALSFPNHVAAGQERISFTWSVADEHSAWDDCKDECTKLGLAAWEMAHALRLQFSFPPFEPRYDIEGALRRQTTRSVSTANDT